MPPDRGGKSEGGQGDKSDTPASPGTAAPSGAGIAKPITPSTGGTPPPSADTIYFVVTELLEGRMPDVSLKTRFGA